MHRQKCMQSLRFCKKEIWGILTMNTLKMYKYWGFTPIRGIYTCWKGVGINDSHVSFGVVLKVLDWFCLINPSMMKNEFGLHQ